MDYSPAASETLGPKTATKKRKTKNGAEEMVVLNKRKTDPEGDQSQLDLSLFQNPDLTIAGQEGKSPGWGSPLQPCG